MSAAMKEGPQLFAVGAGHLPGKEGLITLLRKAGYKVEPMKQVFGETVSTSALGSGLRMAD